MINALLTVVGLASKHSGVPVEQIDGRCAIDQELGLSGDDVTWFVADLAHTFGDFVWAWPWHRFAYLDEPTLMTVIFAMRRWITRPWKKSRGDQKQFERLELGHIALCIESGHWVDP